MRIERREFLALTASLSAACAAAPPAPIELPAAAAPASSATTAPASPEPPPPPAAPPQAAPPKADPPDECAQEDTGSLAICSQLKIAPTCESAGSYVSGCEQLTSQYRPAVAERIAACIVKNAAGRKRCPRYTDDVECAKNAVKTVCVRTAVREQCADMITACTKRKQRVKYTLDHCAHLLSAAAPSFVSNYTFTMAGLHTSDGTPWAEGCWLD